MEKLFITNGYVSGLRKDLNGVLLLDSILQPPIKGPCLDPVVLELTLSDVSVTLYLPIIRYYYPVGESEMLTTIIVVNFADDSSGSGSGGGSDNEDKNDLSIICFDYSPKLSLG